MNYKSRPEIKRDGFFFDYFCDFYPSGCINARFANKVSSLST